jgi:hypothetical protein
MWKVGGGTKKIKNPVRTRPPADHLLQEHSVVMLQNNEKRGIWDKGYGLWGIKITNDELTMTNGV